MIAKDVRVGHVVDGKKIVEVHEISDVGPSLFRINGSFLFFCWEIVSWDAKNKVRA